MGDTILSRCHCSWFFQLRPTKRKSNKFVIKDLFENLVSIELTDFPFTHSVAKELEAMADPHPNVLNLASTIFPSSSTSIYISWKNVINDSWVFKNQKLIFLYLKFHNISTSRSSNQSCADVSLLGIEFTNVSWFFIVINNLKLVNYCSVYATQNAKFFMDFLTFSWYNLLETTGKVLEELNKNPATGRKRDIFTVNYEFCWFTKL